MAVAVDGLSKQSFKFTLQQMVKVVRIVYVVVAIVCVGKGLYQTLIKVQKENVNIRSGIDHESKIKFPSVTFCYKYKHGGKDAILAYHNQLFEGWKESGKFKRDCKYNYTHYSYKVK